MMAASSKVIMVLEDQDLQRQIVVRLLRKLNCHEVLVAANGREALELMNAPAIPRPEIVLCDLNMPEMDGMEFIRHISHAKTRLSVIITSSLDKALLRSVEKMCHAYNVRLLGTIEKPIRQDRLAELLDRHEATGADPLPAEEELPFFTLDEILQGIRNAEIRPFFQPKMDLVTGRMTGAEALARWLHPRYGIVNPSAFLPILERQRQMDELTFLMLSQSARRCRAWQQQGCDAPVSVNLSLISLADTTLADRILDTVQEAGLEPKSVILEITETAAMTKIAPALENLTRLRMRGFGLSIDDYGTGFSSMQQLTRAPFSELKIDQSFITGCAASSEAQLMIESSLAVARGMSIKSVAEGIETQAEWDIVKRMGCDIAQGFFVATPMDEEAFMGFCEAHC